MGITYFYGDWVSKVSYPGTNMTKLPTESIEGLSLDANGIIHWAAGVNWNYGKDATVQREREIALLTDDQLETQFHNILGTKLAEIIKRTSPRNYLIIAVDGLAPLAKIAQQRRRRFMSAQPEEGKVASPKRFDSNCITPGTSFMKRLDAYFQSWIATNRTLLPQTVIYSSHMVPGEGEHKIFGFFRSGEIVQGSGYHLVYGLDADLIMLSVLSPINRILLVRENYHNVVNIDALKAGVYRDLSSHFDVKPSEKIILQDFVIMVYFVGNDFVPHQMCFERVGIAVQTMFEVYHKIGQYTLTSEDGSIMWQSLTNFLWLMGQEEPNLLKKKAAVDFKYPSQILNATAKKVALPPDPNFNSHGSSVATDERYTVTSFDFDMFRAMWYTNAMGPRYGDASEHLTELKLPSVETTDVARMCNLYIAAFQWILQYYIGGKVSSNFVYPYNHCPLIRDVAEQLYNNVVLKATIDVSSVLAKPDDIPITPYDQLVSVIPVASLKLLPDVLRPLISAGGALVDLSPVSVYIEREGKDHDWQGVPILPLLDMVRVQNAVRTVVPKMPADMKTDVDWISRRGERIVIPYKPLPTSRGRGRGRGDLPSRGRGRGDLPPRSSGRGDLPPRSSGRGDLPPQSGSVSSSSGAIQPLSSSIDVKAPVPRPMSAPSRGRGRERGHGKPKKAWTQGLLM